MVEETTVQGDSQVEASEDGRASKKMKLNDSTEPNCELNEKIAKQIEYYFSDVNLMKDKFMKEQLEKNENCVSLSILATFSRLAQLSKDENVIIEALENHTSDYMELDAEKKVVRRKKPLPNKEDFQKELDLRTVHISGFPDSLKFDDLKRFCSQYGDIESLSMRQHFRTKQFKGCIHVTFKLESDVKKILEGETLMFKDRELRRESMDQYHKRKEEMKQNRLDKRSNKKKVSPKT